MMKHNATIVTLPILVSGVVRGVPAEPRLTGDGSPYHRAWAGLLP